MTGKISGNTITLILFCLSNFCFAQKLSSSKIISSTGAVFQGLGDLPGGSFSSSAQGVSADGKVVVGSGSPDSGALAFVWTEETGMISLGNISDNSFNESWAYGISGNGKVIVGSGDVGNSWNTHKGFVWTQENGMTLIGSLDESERYEAFTASQNGSIIVGDGGQQVFRWTEETGCVGLGTLEGRNASRGVDVSDDGSVIVGSSYNLPNWDSEQAYRWTEEDGIVGLGFLPNSNYSFAIAVSNDGKVIVGTGYADGTYPAFRWTKESGMVNIGHLSGKTTTHPQDLTADGSIIVGGSFQNRGASPAAFIWDENNGMRKLQDVLQNDYGLDLTGWTLAVANGITPDGKVIVGWGTNPEGNQEAFRVELDFEESYLGQTPPGNTPVVFARGIISDELQQHGAPAFSPDAKEVFWQTNYQDENNNWIVECKTMKMIEGVWTEPEVTQNGGGPVFSVDGQRLYFGCEGEGQDPYYIEKQENGWSERKYITLVSKYPKIKFAYNLTITSKGSLYFLGYAEELNSFNHFVIYRSEYVDGEYSEPELLPESINTQGDILNSTPFIAPDESYLLFCSRKIKPVDDYGDIYICFRELDGSWTNRIKLDSAINSPGQERFPRISPDGKYLFFTRYTQEYDEDVYWVNAPELIHCNTWKP